MTDGITFPCPACGTKYNVGPHHAGKKTTCRKCKAPMTVPMPDVGNPTVVGATRTIKRADIEAIISASTGDARGKARKTTRQVRGVAPDQDPDIDMKGGASVLRRVESKQPQRPTAQSGRLAGRRPTGAPPRVAPPPAYGRPMPYGPRRKSPLPLVLGIGGGVLALVLVIVLIVVASGSGDPAPGPQIATNTQPPMDQAKMEEASTLADLKNYYTNIGAVKSATDIERAYNLAKERKDNPDFKMLMDSFAAEMSRKAPNESAEVQARIGILLDKDGHPGAKDLLRRASQSLDTMIDVRRAADDPRPGNRREKNQLMVEVATRLGWKAYQRPEKFNEFGDLKLPGYIDYEAAFSGTKQRYLDIELMPEEEITRLQGFEKVVFDSIAAFEDEIARNGEYAIVARKAYLRFLEANHSGSVNRKKNQRAFSPRAMERDGEPVDKVWTYTYWKPFIVMVETPTGTQGIDADLRASLETKAALLQHLYEYFRTNLIDRFNLQRVKPRNNAALAEKEGWPMEIIVLKDSSTFEKYATDLLDRPMPGARAFYSRLHDRVMTYDDTEDPSPDTAWFNEAVLIHETFHLLSDHYAANPQLDESEMQARPRYSSILVQEGLTDSVSGFTRTGEGRDSKYEFMTLNHLRLRDLQNFHRRFTGGKHLFRIRDMQDCRHYGQCQETAQNRARALGLSARNVGIATMNGVSLYYAAACQASYFFVNYKDDKGAYPYRDMWWEYIGRDYKGEINMDSYASKRGVEAFKEVFRIKTDADWDVMDQRFEAFTDALRPENVGSGGGEMKEGDDDAPEPDDDTEDYRLPSGAFGHRAPALPADQWRPARKAA